MSTQKLEPFVIVTGEKDISTKKITSKIRSFIESNGGDPLNIQHAMRVGKVSDEVLEKLDTMCNALEAQQKILIKETENDDSESASKKEDVPPSVEKKKKKDKSKTPSKEKKRKRESTEKEGGVKPLSEKRKSVSDPESIEVVKPKKKKSKVDDKK